MLTPPDGPGTLSFSAQDFDKLAQTGLSAEELSLVEQRIGRRVRLEDGAEVLVLGNPLDEDWGASLPDG